MSRWMSLILVSLILVARAGPCAWAAPASTHGVEPLWSTDVSEVIPYTATYGSTGHVLLQNGNAFMVAGESGRHGLAGLVVVGAGGLVTNAQFGHRPELGGRLIPTAVLATQGNRVLLAMTELDPARSLVAMVDTDGYLRWALPQHGGQARFLPNGDVLIATGNELMRINGSDGDRMWVRNLLELNPYAEEVNFQLPTTIDDRLPLALAFRERTIDGGERFPDPLLVSLSAVNGSVLWRLPRAPAPGRVFEACAPLQLSIEHVSAFFEVVGSQVDVVMERRNSFNGTLAWSTRIPDVEYSDGPCGLVGSISLYALSTRGKTTGTTLVALNHAGALQWRTTLPSTAPTSLRAAADGALLAASWQLRPGGYATVAERRRVSDGSVDWSFEIPARDIDWRVIGSELRIAWSEGAGAARLHLQRRAPATGALIDAVQAQAVAQSLRPSAVKLIDSDPYALMAGLGPDLRGLRVRRLDTQTGAVVWQQEYQLAEFPSQIGGVSLDSGGAGRLVAKVSYVDTDPVSPQPRQAVFAINRDTGAPIWQRALQSSFQSVRPPLAGPNGQVDVIAHECLNPPQCSSTQELVTRLSALDGQPQWAVPVASSTSLVAARGNDVAILGGGAYGILAAANGTSLWSVAASPLALIVAGNGDLVVSRQQSIAGRVRSFVERRAGADGGLTWSAQPGPPDAIVGWPLVTSLPDGDFLLTARMYGSEPNQLGVTRPLLARIDSGTGAIEWTVNPLLERERWQSVRAINPMSASHLWARSLRNVGYLDYEVETRAALTSVALDSGFVGAEHQYAHSYDPPLASALLGFGSILAVTPTGFAMVDNRTVGNNGMEMPRLERWPAVGSTQGSLRLQRLGEPGLITGQGASTLVEIEIENTANGPLVDALVGFASSEGGLKAQLRGCELLAGTGSCPILPGSGLDLAITLGSEARMRLRYEIHDPGYRPRQIREPTGKRGLFHVDPPYAYGDADLGDNTAEIHVALGGTSIGFE